MRFEIKHTTRYTYDDPAMESVCELRLYVPSLPSQRVEKRSLRIKPEVPVVAFDDFFGNRVEGFSVYFKHDRLSIDGVARDAHMLAATRRRWSPGDWEDVSVEEWTVQPIGPVPGP